MRTIKSFKMFIAFCMLFVMTLCAFPNAAHGAGLKNELIGFFSVKEGKLIANSIAANYGYEKTATDPDTQEPMQNTISKAEFATEKVLEFFKENYKSYKMQKAFKKARKEAKGEADLELEGL